MPPRKSSRSRNVMVSWSCLGSPFAFGGQVHGTLDIHVSCPALPSSASVSVFTTVGAEHPAELVRVVEEPAHEGDDGVAAFLVLGAGVVAHRPLEGERVRRAALCLGRAGELHADVAVDRVIAHPVVGLGTDADDVGRLGEAAFKLDGPRTWHHRVGVERLVAVGPSLLVHFLLARQGEGVQRIADLVGLDAVRRVADVDGTVLEVADDVVNRHGQAGSRNRSGDGRVRRARGLDRAEAPPLGRGERAEPDGAGNLERLKDAVAVLEPVGEDVVAELVRVQVRDRPASPRPDTTSTSARCRRPSARCRRRRTRT